MTKSGSEAGEILDREAEACTSEVYRYDGTRQAVIISHLLPMYVHTRVPVEKESNSLEQLRTYVHKVGSSIGMWADR
jgi:hypothetical protein